MTGVPTRITYSAVKLLIHLLTFNADDDVDVEDHPGVDEFVRFFSSEEVVYPADWVEDVHSRLSNGQLDVYFFLKDYFAGVVDESWGAELFEEMFSVFSRMERFGAVTVEEYEEFLYPED